MSQRLTEELKSSIIQSLVRHRFGAEKDKLEKQRPKIGDAIYKRSFVSRDRLKMASLPEGWLPTTTSVDAQVGEFYRRFPLSDARPVPYSRDRSRCLISLDVADPLAIRIQEFQDNWSDLMKRSDQARAEARSIVDSVTTTNKLIKVWPEIEPFVPVGKPANLPAVEVDKVNKTFKLPVKKAA
jgi:hypothetical protein